MEDLVIEATDRTPGVSFKTNGELFIGESSIPEDVLTFYKELFAWMDAYCAAPRGSTTLDLKLKFFNTSTSKCLFTIFQKLEAVKAKGFDVVINWYYRLDDTDMYESGLDFQQLLKVPFKIHKL